VLHRHAEIPLVYIVLDVLGIEGRSVMGEPYQERRRILEQMPLEGPCWSNPGGIRGRRRFVGGGLRP
jgi:bifunctional non-homologous end joining protein LigD